MKSLLISSNIILSLWLFAAGVSMAQDQNRQVGDLEIASVEGELTAVAGDRLKIKTEDGKEVFAVLSQKSTLMYKGTAEIGYLRPGQFVRFVTAFNSSTGMPQEAVKKLEIFRAARKRRMSMQERQSQTPGIYPYIANNKDDGKKNRNDVGRNRAAVKPTSGQLLQIVGQVRAIAGNKLQVLAGNRPLIVPLDTQAEISVLAGDAMFCMPGDKVAIEGLRNPAQPDWVQAESVEITGVNSLSPVAANSGRIQSTRSRRAAVRNKDADKDGKSGNP